MTGTYLILKVTVQPASHIVPMEINECFMFGNICACLHVLGNIGKFNSHSILDIIIGPLEHF